MKKTLLILVLAGILLAGVIYGVLLLLDRQPPDFAKVGGTVLVYEYDPQKLAGEGMEPAGLCDTIRHRLNLDFHYIEIKPVDSNRIEFRIPRTEPHHAVLLQDLKDLLAQTGHLDFRILANERDDARAFTAAKAWFERETNLEELDRLAQQGLPPPPPLDKNGGQFFWSTGHADGWSAYSWVELSWAELTTQHLAGELNKENNPSWLEAAAARKEGRPVVFGPSRALLYSRPRVNLKLRPDMRFDCFFLIRGPQPGKELTGKHLDQVTQDFERIDEDSEQLSRPVIDLKLSAAGGEAMLALTTANRPTPLRGDSDYRRCVCLIVNGQVVTSPQIASPIRQECQLTFPSHTADEVAILYQAIRRSSLPAALKPAPVEERDVPPASP